MLAENEKRNTKAILHGIGGALHGFHQGIRRTVASGANRAGQAPLEQAPTKRYGRPLPVPVTYPE
jgi:hypothetical protein